jgi:hypothetical protein
MHPLLVPATPVRLKHTKESVKVSRNAGSLAR